MRRDDDDGYDERQRRPRGGGPPVLPWVFGAFGVVVALCLLGFVLGAFGTKPREAAKDQPPVAVNYKAMTAAEFADEWGPSPLATARKYQTDGVQLTGTLKRVETLGDDVWIGVTDDSGEWKRETRVKVTTQGAKDGVARCKVGSTVVVKGRTSGEANQRPQLVADEVAPAP